MAEDFITRTARQCFPESYVAHEHLDNFFSTAAEMSKYVAEMAFYTRMVPEYFALIHPNAQIDNAYYWRDDTGAAHCGLLDWGGCSHGSMPGCLANGWIGAEPSMLDEHEEKLSGFFVDEYAKVTGVVLDVEDFYMHVKLAHACVFFGCCANVRWCRSLLTPEEWMSVTDRFNRQIDDNFLLRCYFVQLEMFLGMWQRRSPYESWQRWMRQTGMPRK